MAAQQVVVIDNSLIRQITELQREFASLREEAVILREVVGSLTLTAKEAQKYLLDRYNLSVTTATIHNWGQQGKITAVGSGRQVRYSTLNLIAVARKKGVQHAK